MSDRKIKKTLPIKVFKNTKQIESCAKFYVNLLRLNDWNISYFLEDNFDACGRIYIDYVRKEASIFIRKTADIKNNKVDFQEATLVHELIHLLLPTIPDEIDVMDKDFYFWKLIHSCIENLSQAIIKLKYNLNKEDYLIEDAK